MKILVLEDDRNRECMFEQLAQQGHEITMCPTVYWAKDSLLEEDEFDIFFIDHDLGGETYVGSDQEETGAGLCRWWRDNMDKCATVKMAVTHSLNYDGARNISSILNSMSITCYEIPFTELSPNINRYIKLFQETLDTL